MMDVYGSQKRCGKEPNRKKAKESSSNIDIDKMRKLVEIKDIDSDEDMSDLLAQFEGLSMDVSDEPEESPRHQKGSAPSAVAAKLARGSEGSQPDPPSRVQPLMSLVSLPPAQSAPWVQPSSAAAPGFPSVVSSPHSQQQQEPPAVGVLPRATVPTSPSRPAPNAPARPGSTTVPLSVAVSVPRTLNAEDADKYKMLSTRRDQYKMAAISAKRAGDIMTAVNYLRVSKQFGGVLLALEEGKPIDLTKMPPPPPSKMPPPPPSTTSTVISDKKKWFNAVMEALQQRLGKYKEAASQSRVGESSNTSKVKRLARIVKQYNDAIKLHRTGKASQVGFEDLPCPPGFPPIPAQPSASNGSE